MHNQGFYCFVFCIFFAGCSVNPVTGDRDFMLVSGEQELAMGLQQYVPMQQSQGGPYDVDPALTAYVENVGQKLAAASDVKLPYEFVVLNNSVPNAWALPGGKIAINRGLLTELNSEAELAAVLGHEVVHAAARHSAQQMSRGMMTQGLVLATTVAASDSGYGDLAAMGAGLAGQLTLSRYGRDAELESDKYGMRYMSKAGYDPQGAVTLQETFVRLSEGHEQDWMSGLFASHPPSEERVKENRLRASKLPAGGELGTERYAAAMKKTMAAKPAYEAYDKGRKALGKKRKTRHWHWRTRRWRCSLRKRTSMRCAAMCGLSASNTTWLSPTMTAPSTGATVSFITSCNVALRNKSLAKRIPRLSTWSAAWN